MKRFFILLIVAVFCLCGVAFAEESTLIDFNTLIDDYQGENQATLLDLSEVAGSSFSEEDLAAMQISLEVANWEVDLASSARTIENQRYSDVMPVVVGDSDDNYAGQSVMGIRVHFPDHNFNSFAVVRPPYDIPAFMTSDEELNGSDANQGFGNMFNNIGIVKNVGVLKSVTVNILGMNFPNGFGIILEDESGEQFQVFMDYLDFDGWRSVTWTNPNYIQDVRDRELNRDPLYPNSTPFIKLIGFIVYKDASQRGGDFITYIKDVTVRYDKAIRDDVEASIVHEEVWGILSDREEDRRNYELQRLGNQQVLRYLEQQRMDSEGADTSAAAE